MESFNVKLPALERLSLVANPNLSKLDLALYPNLKKLALESFPKFPSGENQIIELKDLDSVSSLKELKLSRLDLMDEDFRALEMLMNLETIELDTVPVGDENLHFLAGSPALKTLNLNNEESPSADSLCELGLMPSLETLIIQNAEFLAGSGMAFVRNMPKLRVLALLGCKLTDEDMHGFTSAKELESLGLNNCSQLTDAGLACLNEMKDLRFLRLANCAAENCEIQELPHLRNLILEEFSELENLQIKDLPELKLLAIHGSGLKTLTLTNLPELNSLGIQRCPALSFMKMGGIHSLDHFDAIGSEQLDLTGLSALRNVRSVALAHTQLRQEGVLDSLREMQSLEWLTIANHRDLEILERIGKRLQNQDDEDQFDFVSEEKTLNEMFELFRPAFRIDEEEAIREALPDCDVSFSINLK